MVTWVVWTWIKHRRWGKRWKFRGDGVTGPCGPAERKHHLKDAGSISYIQKREQQIDWLVKDTELKETVVKTISLLATFSSWVLYLLSFCFPSLLLLFLALLLNYLIF